MIDTYETIWPQLAAPLDPKDISWRIDSKPMAREGKYVARFVCYVEAGTVRERLDAVVPGEWSVRLEALPEYVDSNGVPAQAFKATMTIGNVSREDVGQGPDYKQAATDAFKRVAVRFGIGHELYAMEQNWVEVDSDSKYAKPVEDPQVAYNRRYGTGTLHVRTLTVEEAREAVKGNGPSSTPRAASAPTKTLTHVPFGKFKGKLFSDLPNDELQSSYDWCVEKGKTDVAAAYRAELERRQGQNLFEPESRNDSDDDLPF